MIRKVIPKPWPVLHTPRSVGVELDAHGNSRIVAGDPVVRYVIAIFQTGYRVGLSSNEMFSPEFLAEVATKMHMVIPSEDLGFYSSGDQVLISGSVAADGSYVDGVAFRVDGKPASDLEGPWPMLYKNFGGMVKIARVN